MVKNAEAYYRTMVQGGPESWNIRDRHMTETLERLMQLHGPEAKAIVWEHNTHIGDARFTDMADDGMVNIGQLVARGHGDEDVVLVGFGSHRGSVIAGGGVGRADGANARARRPARIAGRKCCTGPARRTSLLLFDEARRKRPCCEKRGHRAIGVVYHPEYEQYGNYVPTVLPRRYDALLYIEETQALHPLHMPVRKNREVPETYPSGV